MTDRKLGAIVLAAGSGTRMKSARPKVLHEIASMAMVGHVLKTVDGVGVRRTTVVVAPGMDDVRDAVHPVPVSIQSEALGTAHAALAAEEKLSGFEGDVFILFGDTPLITVETLARMAAARDGEGAPSIVVLGMRPAGENAYGRLVLDKEGVLRRIVEFKDASEAERAIPLCNSGVMLVDGRVLFDLLSAVGNDNAKGEYYLTDIVAIGRERGLDATVVEGSEAELLGVNSRVELATAEAILQDRLRQAAMLGGVTMTAPETVFLSHDTRFGRDVTVGPHVVFRPGVAIGDGVEIKGFCHFEGATVAAGAILGPYARLRPEARVEEGAHIGNFVEVKKATIERGAKVNHLTYIGDARVGAGANIGAGTITCNYDGFAKHHTEIGEGAFIGSNTALVAPVTIGAGAIVAAGSTISRDVEADALAIERAEQHAKPGWAARFREIMTKARVRRSA